MPLVAWRIQYSDGVLGWFGLRTEGDEISPVRFPGVYQIFFTDAGDERPVPGAYTCVDSAPVNVPNKVNNRLVA